MPQIDIQTYFKQNWLRKIGSGSSMVVYGTRHVAVKVFDFNRERQSTLTYLSLTNREPGFFASFENAGKAVRELQEKRQKEYGKIKTRLGGCVLPFEVPAQLSCTLWKYLIIPDERQFDHPIIQPRMQKGLQLSDQLRMFAKAQDLLSVSRLMGMWHELHIELMRRGMYFRDFISENYYLFGDNLVVGDLGSIWSDKTVVINSFKGDQPKQLLNCNIAAYKRLITNAFKPGTPGQRDDLEELLNRFEKFFRDICSERTIKEIWNTGKQNESLVPDVFPLDIN